MPWDQIMYAAKQSAGIHALKPKVGQGRVCDEGKLPDKFYLTKLLE